MNGQVITHFCVFHHEYAYVFFWLVVVHLGSSSFVFSLSNSYGESSLDIGFGCVLLFSSTFPPVAEHRSFHKMHLFVSVVCVRSVYYHLVNLIGIHFIAVIEN